MMRPNASRFDPLLLRRAIMCLVIAGGFTISSAHAVMLRTYVTGENPAYSPDTVVFSIDFNPAVPGSGIVGVAVHETRSGRGLDGIDFVPGTGNAEIVVGGRPGAITHYNVNTGLTMADFVASTTAIGPPAPSPAASQPSTIKSMPTRFYYTENQFGFAAGPQRIIQKAYSVAPGGEIVTIDGGAVPAVDFGAGPVGIAGGLRNLEGLEIVDVAGTPRLYFFAKDPTPASVDKRALMSIGLTVAGVWDGLAPKAHITGLTEGAGGLTDGSDELDFDPGTGWLFGTNIDSGEVIAFNPFTGVEIIPGMGSSTTHFIDAQPAPAPPFLGLELLRSRIDGIRSTGTGHLLFAGQLGVMGIINIAGVLADGADDGDVYSVVLNPGLFFDDMTPFVASPIPEPSSLTLWSLAAFCCWRIRRKSIRERTVYSSRG